MNRTAVRNEVALSGRRGDGSGAGCSAAQGALVGVAEAATGRLDVGARSLSAGCVVMERQRVQAGQAGPGRQKDGEQKESLGPGQPSGMMSIVEHLSEAQSSERSWRGAESRRKPPA